MRDEREKLFAYAISTGYKEYKRLGWILVIEYDAQEIFKPAVELRNFLFVFGIVLVVFAGIAGTILYRIIANPIQKLTNTVDEVSKGNLDVQIEKSNIEEINKLAEALDRVLTTMKRAIKRMKEKEE